ncbi:MAG: energy transducer TonB, partial [Candidatus Desantisbacteria bacterium]
KIRSPRPEYPAWAEKKGVESQVVIYFTVTPDGMVNSDAFVEQTSGYAQLDQLALQALKGWRFAPLPMDAEQKDQWGRVTFRFVR